jgi:hypothetical protein
MAFGYILDATGKANSAPLMHSKFVKELAQDLAAFPLIAKKQIKIEARTMPYLAEIQFIYYTCAFKICVISFFNLGKSFVTVL